MLLAIILMWVSVLFAIVLPFAIGVANWALSMVLAPIAALVVLAVFTIKRRKKTQTN